MQNPFLKKSVGIDISDSTIEVVEISFVFGKPSLVNLGRVALDHGVVVRGRVNDSAKLGRALTTALSGARPQPIKARRAVFGIPDVQLFTHIFTTRAISREDIDIAVTQEVDVNIPIAKDDVLYSYQIQQSGPDGSDIAIIAASRKIISEWYQFFRLRGISIDAFDGELIASYRSIFPTKSSKPICIVDIGAMTTSVALFDARGLRYSYLINTGRSALTDEVTQTLAALDEKDKNFFTLIKALEPIMGGIRQAISFFKDKQKLDVTEIILVGGLSRMSGLARYIKTNIGIPVRLGEPYIKLPTSGDYIFTEAIGLALRTQDPMGPALSVDPYRKRLEKDQTGERKMPWAVVFVTLGIIVIVAALVFVMRLMTQWPQEEQSAMPASQSSTDIQPTKAESRVTIVPTDTGWLRVRSGPARKYPEISRVNPGESFLLLQEQGDWLKIKLPDGREGWVSSEFVRKDGR